MKLRFGRRDGGRPVAQLAGVGRHVPRAELELVDAGHRLVDQRPQLGSDRARACFA